MTNGRDEFAAQVEVAVHSMLADIAPAVDRMMQRIGDEYVKKWYRGGALTDAEGAREQAAVMIDAGTRIAGLIFSKVYSSFTTSLDEGAVMFYALRFRIVASAAIKSFYEQSELAAKARAMEQSVDQPKH